LIRITIDKQTKLDFGLILFTNIDKALQAKYK